MKVYVPFPVIDVVATGKNIQKLRESRNLSVLDVQIYLGLAAPQAIYQWQQGRCLPSVDNLYALSALFEVTMNEIIVPVMPRVKHKRLFVEPQEHKFVNRFVRMSAA